MVAQMIDENDNVDTKPNIIGEDIDTIEGLNIDVLQLCAEDPGNNIVNTNEILTAERNEFVTEEETNGDFVVSFQRHEIYLTDTLEHIKSLLLPDNLTRTQQDKHHAFYILGTLIEENKDVILQLQSKKEMLDSRISELIKLKDEFKFQHDIMEKEVYELEKLLNFTEEYVRSVEDDLINNENS